MRSGTIFRGDHVVATAQRVLITQAPTSPSGIVTWCGIGSITSGEMGPSLVSAVNHRMVLDNGQSGMILVAAARGTVIEFFWTPDTAGADPMQPPASSAIPSPSRLR